MPKQSETGHAKNVANFESLITFCTAYGTTYNPSRAGLKITALNTLYTNSLAAVANVNIALSPNSVAINNRDLAFKSVGKLIIKVANAAYACDISKNTKDDIKSIMRKLTGRRLKPKNVSTTQVPGGTEVLPPRTHSASQMSFDQRIENFDKLIQLLKGVPTYAPNETDLTIVSLTAILASLRTTNTAVQTTNVAISNARLNRNKVLYTPKTGLHDIALAIKSYVKSLYGPSSPQYKQISKIKFTIADK